MRKSDLVSRVIDGEVVILDRQGGFVHQLNATASCIWHACDGARSPEEIAAHLAATFDRAPETVLDDVRAALEDFRRLGLLVEAHVSAGVQQGGH